MKNLKNFKNLSFLPQREQFRDPEGWGRSKGTWHPVDGVNPWERVRRMLKSNIGKPFDKVFSDYCSQVPKYQQHYFLEEFEGRRWYGATYYVDDDGNIQKVKEKKSSKKVIFYSEDYKTETRHKETGELYPEGWWLGPADRKDYERIIIEGWCKEFSSKNDPEYKRLVTDLYKKKKAEARKRAKERKKSYLVVPKSEKKSEDSENN